MVRQSQSLFKNSHRLTNPLAYELGLKAGRAFGFLLATKPELATMSKTRLAKLTVVIIQSNEVQDPQTAAESLLKKVL
jgi:hypothetical protein